MFGGGTGIGCSHTKGLYKFNHEPSNQTTGNSRTNTHRVTWGKAPPFGDDLSLTYLFASTSEKSYMYVTNYMLCV